jgi:hypothetical protein
MTLSGLISLGLSVLASGTLAADVEIVSPKPGAELTGKVEVVARVTPPTGQTIGAVIVQGETGDMVQLAPGSSGTYSAVIDTTRLPNGKQSLMVIESVKGLTPSRSKHADDAWESPFREYDAEVAVTVRNPYHFFWGDLHAHTSYSDGVLTPKDAYQYARDRSKLDFFAVTDHSQCLTFDEYADVIAQANRCNAPGKFVTLYGAESTSSSRRRRGCLQPATRSTNPSAACTRWPSSTIPTRTRRPTRDGGTTTRASTIRRRLTPMSPWRRCERRKRKPRTSRS